MVDLISTFLGGTRFFGYWSSPQRYGNQFRVKSRQDVVNLLNTYNGVYNCGISICSYLGEVPYLLYLPFDFDSYNLEESWVDAKKFYNFMVKSGYDISIQSSGFRGFHCLVSTIPNLYSKRQIRQAQQWFKDLLHLETCDTAIFGDWRRLIRIPGTLHCGKFIKDKNKKWKRLGEGSYCKVIKYNEGKLFDLNEYFEDDFPDYEFSAVSNNKPLHSYPCVDDVLDNYKDEFGRREPPQLIRYSYVAYWLRSGKTPKEIYKMLEDRHSIGKEYEWYDWDDDITMNQIIHISGRGDDYHPLKCETIKSLGFCLENKCRYFIDDWKVKSVRDII